MADRNVKVILSLIASGFVAGAKQAEQAAAGLFDKVEANKQSLDTLGTGMMTVGAATLAGVGLVTKAAMDWESAWAGVLKTVDGSDEQIRNLEGSLREMARTMPATHAEIAAVAEAAGQLGVATDDVAGFTKTMIMLGETTNVSADEAATAIAQIQNVTGMAASDVDRFAAVLVKLGNNGASTEADILALANRIAGAANIAGLAEKDLLALSNAMASAGIQAEVGGSAMSRALIGMNTAVLDGGDKLTAFADVAGMTAAEFASAWRADPVTAVEAFVTGLSQINAEGGNAAAALGSVGLKGTQNTQVFLALAGASDMLTESIAMAGDEWNSAGALVDEYGKRVQTTEAQVQIAWNSIKDAAIDAGAVMLPLVAGLAQSVAGLAQAFTALPVPVKATGTVIAGLAGASLVGVGGFIKLVQTAAELRSALATVREAFPGVASGIKGMAGGAAAAAAIMAALNIAFAVANDSLDRLAPSAERVRGALLELGRGGGGSSINETFRTSAGYADDLGEALEFMSRQVGPAASGTSQFGESLMGMIAPLYGARSGMDVVTTSLGRIDAELAGLSTDQAVASFQELSKQWDFSRFSAETLVASFPAFATALQGIANETGAGVLSAQELADWMGGKIPPAVAKGAAAAKDGGLSMGILGGAADEAAESLGDATEALVKMGNAMLSLSGSQIGYEASLASATEAIKEHGQAALTAAGEIDITSKQGQSLKSSLDGVASSALSVIDNMVKTGASTAEVSAFQQRAAGDFIQTAGAMGVSTAQAIELAARYGLIPSNVATAVSAPGATISRQQAIDLTGALMAVPKLTNATVLAPGARPSKAEVDAFVTSVGKVPGLTTAQIRTIADLYGVEAAKRAIASVNDKTVTVTAHYRTVGAPMRAVASGGVFEGAGMVQSFASGGFPSIGSQQPQIRAAGGAGIRWAEEGAGPWEAFISGHPAKRNRSRWLLEETARRLGGMVNWATPYADGGFHYGANYNPSSITKTSNNPGPVELGPHTIGALIRGFVAGADASVTSHARAVAAAGRPL